MGCCSAGVPSRLESILWRLSFKSRCLRRCFPILIGAHGTHSRRRVHKGFQAAFLDPLRGLSACAFLSCLKIFAHAFFPARVDVHKNVMLWQRRWQADGSEKQGFPHSPGEEYSHAV